MDETQQVPNQIPVTPLLITTPVTTQATPTSKIPMIFITVIVVLLGVASYFGFQYYQHKQDLTQQPAANSSDLELSSSAPIEEWKKYTNTKHKYYIKQPKDALVGSFDARSALFKEGIGDEDQLDILLSSQTELFKNFIQIEVTDATAYKKSLADAVNDIYSKQKEHFQTTIISELIPLKYLGYDGYEYTFTGQAMVALNWGGVVEEGEYKVRIFEKDKYYFAFYSRTGEIFDKILSTFRFED